MKRLLLAAAFLVHAICAYAADGVSAEVGVGSRQVEVLRAGMQWKHEVDWLAGSRWTLYWDAGVGAWNGDVGSLVELGLTPVFRYARHERGLYFDGGIGVHWLSETHISSAVDFSTRFQFGDHVALGYRFKRYDFALRVQHFSNAGIENPNPGINFLSLRVGYALR
jgi:lipid A 3-O-deacylase